MARGHLLWLLRGRGRGWSSTLPCLHTCTYTALGRLGSARGVASIPLGVWTWRETTHALELACDEGGELLCFGRSGIVFLLGGVIFPLLSRPYSASVQLDSFLWQLPQHVYASSPSCHTACMSLACQKVLSASAGAPAVQPCRERADFHGRDRTYTVTFSSGAPATTSRTRRVRAAGAAARPVPPLALPPAPSATAPPRSPSSSFTSSASSASPPCGSPSSSSSSRILSNYPSVCRRRHSAAVTAAARAMAHTASRTAAVAAARDPSRGPSPAAGGAQHVHCVCRRPLSAEASSHPRCQLSWLHRRRSRRKPVPDTTIHRYPSACLQPTRR